MPKTINNTLGNSANFTQVANALLSSKDLSWGAKGMLVYLLSKPSDWRIYKADIKNHATNGMDSVMSILKELRNKDCLTLNKITEQGKIKAWKYELNSQNLGVGAKTNFTQIGNALINEKKLSWTAKGVLFYLLSKPTDWKVMVEDIAHHSTNGLASIRSAMKELRVLGFISLMKIIDKAGKIIEWQYKVFDFVVEQAVKHTAIKAQTKCDDAHTANKKSLVEKLKSKQKKHKNTKSSKAPMKKSTSYIETVNKLKEQLEFDILKNRHTFKYFLEEWIFLIADYLSTDGEFIFIGKNKIPTVVVRERMLGLTQDHIEIVKENMDKITYPIDNVKSYVFASLYNSLSTFRTDVALQVQASFYNENMLSRAMAAL